VIEAIWLVHPEEAMCAAFGQRFAGLPAVRIIRGRFEDLEPHDCFVTAGNAFGLMTAGIDAAVVRFFGDELMHRVQQRILDQFFGEQPVGTTFVLPTGHPNVPFLAHAPTMRVPGSIEGTDKVYAATWSALLAIHAHNVTSDRKIEAVAFPAMGTGFGRWRPPTGITGNRPTGWTGTSSWNATRQYATRRGVFPSARPVRSWPPAAPGWSFSMS
jgi:O-acetyl-ADP-ribose deacetylase (regulator of RNase III)